MRASEPPFPQATLWPLLVVEKDVGKRCTGSRGPIPPYRNRPHEFSAHSPVPSRPHQWVNLVKKRKATRCLDTSPLETRAMIVLTKSRDTNGSCSARTLSSPG